MNLKEVITESQINLQIGSNTKEETIKIMSESLENLGILNNKEEFIKSVLDREMHSTTGIGNEIAIPHGKSLSVNKAAVFIGKTTKKIDWNSLDSKPVSIIFLLAIPDKDKGDLHLKILSEIAVKLMDDEIVEKLKKADDGKQIIKILE